MPYFFKESMANESRFQKKHLHYHQIANLNTILRIFGNLQYAFLKMFAFIQVSVIQIIKQDQFFASYN